MGRALTSSLEADKARLAALAGLLDKHRLKALYAERLEILERLTAAGVPQRELAELAGTTAGNVKVALHKGRASPVAAG